MSALYEMSYLLASSSILKYVVFLHFLHSYIGRGAQGVPDITTKVPLLGYFVLYLLCLHIVFSCCLCIVICKNIHDIHISAPQCSVAEVSLT